MAQTSIEPKSQKIVIIEGAASFGQQLSELLNRDGYKNVFLYKTGNEGLKGIYDVLPHLVLVDIVLPDMDGYQILARKQDEPLLAKIPLFLLSTEGVAINMRNIPDDSVTEIIISLHARSIDILKKINEFFGYTISADVIVPKDPTEVKKKILWIEDDKMIGTILSKKLIASGFDLVHTKDGEEALRSLESMKPDVMIVDLLLPGMSGFDFLQKIKDDASFKNIPKIVLSNLSKTVDIERAKNLGASKFLVKASTSLDQIVAEIADSCK